MVAVFDCKSCIHKEVCCYPVSITNEDFNSCLERLEAYTTDNMNIRIECKYREEAHFNGTTFKTNI